MIEVRQTTVFRDWLDGLVDGRAAERIAQRIVRLQSGLFGELRVDYGPGYRVYFVWRGRVLILLLCGGDKRTQKKDVTRAKLMAKEV
ncbi:MAG: type II toxin-antitoxin system RelE/ParE family toxin [Devosia sp.]